MKRLFNILAISSLLHHTMPPTNNCYLEANNWHRWRLISYLILLIILFLSMTSAPIGANPGTGDIDPDIKDTLVFAPDAAETPDIIQVTDDIYAVVYRGGIPSRAFLKTIQIAPDGSITDPPKDTLSSMRKQSLTRT